MTIKPELYSASELLANQSYTTIGHSVPLFENLLRETGFPSGLTVLAADQSSRWWNTLLVPLVYEALNVSQQVVWIDGNNGFPLYQLSDFVRSRGGNPEAILERVLLARGFNYFQMRELVDNSAHIAGEVGLFILAGFVDQFFSDEALKYLSYEKRPRHDVYDELYPALQKINEIGDKWACPTIITAPLAPKSKYRPLGGRFLQHCLKTLIVVQHIQPYRYAQLVQHPWLKEGLWREPIDPTVIPLTNDDPVKQMFTKKRERTSRNTRKKRLVKLKTLKHYF